MGRRPYQRLLQSLSIGDVDQRAAVNHTAAARCRAGNESSERRAVRRSTSRLLRTKSIISSTFVSKGLLQTKRRLRRFSIRMVDQSRSYAIDFSRASLMNCPRIRARVSGGGSLLTWVTSASVNRHAPDDRMFESPTITCRRRYFSGSAADAPLTRS